MLLLLAGCSLARGNPRIRVLGAVALVAATLSRYESWPVAVVWSAVTALESVRHRKWVAFGLALLVLVPPIAWMAHGFSHHHDALFFVKRVASYRRALGITPSASFSQLLSTPKHLIMDAPELWVIGGIVAVVTWVRKTHPLRRRWANPSLALLAILLFLIIGDWRDGAPTHHVGRTLLPLWLFMSLVISGALMSNVRRSALHAGIVGSLLLASSFGVALLATKPNWLRVDGFCPRHEETEIGEQAANAIPRGQRLAIDTPDYGYFAIQAAFARPGATLVLDLHDPRHPLPRGVHSSPSSIRANLTEARWLIAPKAKLLNVPSRKFHWQGNSLFLSEMD